MTVTLKSRLARLSTLTLLAGLVSAVPLVSTPSAIADVHTLSTGPSANVTVSTTNGNTTYVGGTFEAIGPQTGGGAQVSLADGNVAMSMPPVDGVIADSASDGAGGWYIVGGFTAVGGVARNGAAHIKSDGSVDANFAPPQLQGQYNKVLFDGSQLVVAGAFFGFGSDPQAADFVSRTNIAQLSSTGQVTAWAPTAGVSWDPNASPPVQPAGDAVMALKLSGGHLLIGGNFTAVQGVTRSGLASINYSTQALDSNWNPQLANVLNIPNAPTVAPQVSTIEVATVGGSSKVFFGGSFTSVNTTDRSNAAEVSGDLTSAAALQSWDPSPNAPVYQIKTVQSALIIAGTFTQLYSDQSDANKITRNKIARVNTTTGIATSTFDPNADGDVLDVATDANNVYVTGSFTNIGGQDRKRVALLDGTDGTAKSWNPGAYGIATTGQTPAVNDISLDTTSGNAYLGGSFTVVNGSERKFFAAFDSGSLSSATLAMDQAPTFMQVNGSYLYISGYFAKLGGSDRSGIARVQTSDLSLDSGWNPSVDSPVKAMLFGTSTVYLGGMFTQLDSQSRNYAGEVSLTDGSVTSWDPDATNAVFSLAWSPDGNIVAGGNFTGQDTDDPGTNPGIGGKNRSYIAEIGTDGVATDWNLQCDGPIFGMYLQGSQLIVAGGFQTLGNETRNGLAELSFDDVTDTDWDPMANGAISTSQLINGILYVAGDFSHIGGEDRSHVAAINLANGLATSWNPAVGGAVTAISGSNQILIGGQFTSAGADSRNWYMLTTAASLASPVVADYSPKGGTSSGNDVVTITGTDLGSATVTFGGTPATITSNSSTSITVNSPAHAAGAVDLTVSTAGGRVVKTNGYTYYDGPVITGVSPPRGPLAGGNTIYIDGDHLDGTSQVKIGTVDATDFWYLSDEDRVEVVVPQGLSIGSADVYLANPAGNFTLPAAYEYLATPAITNISPAAGTTAGGVTVNISGSGLSYTSEVKFGNQLGTALSVINDTSLSVVAPAGGSGAVDVRVTTPGGIFTSSGGYNYVSAPALTAISPSAGPVAGGQSVVITGTNLLTTSAVTIGGVAVTSFLAVNDTTVNAQTAAGTVGSADVVVTTAAGSATLSKGYRYAAVPAITSVTPNGGPSGGGTQVVIAGTDLASVSSVKFGTNAASFQQNSSTKITAFAPAGTAGAVTIAVTTPGGTVNQPSAFTYYNQPAVSSINPVVGSVGGGTSVTLSGSNLAGATAVTFGSAAATINSVTANSITVTAPAHALGAVTVTVTTPGGSANAPASFTYQPGPVISGISPLSGPQSGGTAVVISGTNLGSAAAVSFGGNNGSITANTATSITVTAPAGTYAGAVNVLVTTSLGTAVSVNGFTYIPAPTISQIDPAQGQEGGGDTVVITGTNLSGATSVKFGTADATITANTATTVTVTSPSGTIGSVGVSVTTLGGTASSGTFVYLPGPNVSSVLPAGGPIAGGTQVTITGTNLDGVTSVTFGGIAASIVSNSSTQLVVTTGPRAAGLVNVVITNSGGTNTRTNAFRYANAPTIQNFTPKAGPLGGGQSVVISGQNLLGASSVTIGGQTAASFTVDSATQITAVTSAASAGSGNVAVVAFGGTATSNGTYTYSSAPAFGSVGPITGSVDGGQQVTINGSNLSSVTGVLFGTTAGTITVKSSNLIQVMTPAHVQGEVAITLQSPGGDWVEPSAFTYMAAPRIDSVSPSAGPLGGLSNIAINGANLDSATAVYFGGVAGSIDSAAANQLSVTAPAAGAGTVDVSVRTTAGMATKSLSFTYVANPAVTGLSANAGPASGGQSLVLTGSNLSTVSAVSFGADTATIQSATSTKVTVRTPAHSAGPVTVSITTAGGNLPNAASYTYVDSPVLTQISAAAGPVNGGTSVTLSGSNLSTLTSVSFGGAVAVLNSVTADSAVVTTTARTAGTVDVVATTAGGQAALSRAFTYQNSAAPNPPIPADLTPVITNLPLELGAGKPYTFTIETRSASVQAQAVPLPATSVSVSSGGVSISANTQQPSNLVAANGYVIVRVQGAQCTATIFNGWGQCTLTVKTGGKAVVSAQFYTASGQASGVPATSPALRVGPVAINSVVSTVKGCKVVVKVAGVTSTGKRKVVLQVNAGHGWKNVSSTKSNAQAKWSQRLSVAKSKGFKVRALQERKASGTVKIAVSGKFCKAAG